MYRFSRHIHRESSDLASDLREFREILTERKESGTLRLVAGGKHTITIDQAISKVEEFIKNMDEMREYFPM